MEKRVSSAKRAHSSLTCTLPQGKGAFTNDVTQLKVERSQTRGSEAACGLPVEFMQPALVTKLEIYCFN